MDAGNHVIEAIRQLIEWGLGIEVLAVAVIVAGAVIVALARGIVHYLHRTAYLLSGYQVLMPQRRVVC